MKIIGYTTEGGAGNNEICVVDATAVIFNVSVVTDDTFSKNSPTYIAHVEALCYVGTDMSIPHRLYSSGIGLSSISLSERMVYDVNVTDKDEQNIAIEYYKNKIKNTLYTKLAETNQANLVYSFGGNNSQLNILNRLESRSFNYMKHTDPSTIKVIGYSTEPYDHENKEVLIVQSVRFVPRYDYIVAICRTISGNQICVRTSSIANEELEYFAYRYKNCSDSDKLKDNYGKYNHSVVESYLNEVCSLLTAHAVNGYICDLTTFDLFTTLDAR